MKWFGESWGAPVNETCARIEVPDGECCPRCQRSIRPGDQGLQLQWVDLRRYGGGLRLPPRLFLCWGGDRPRVGL